MNGYDGITRFRHTKLQEIHPQMTQIFADYFHLCFYLRLSVSSADRSFPLRPDCSTLHTNHAKKPGESKHRVL